MSDKCKTCNGTGTIEKPHPSGWEEWGTIYGECPTCGGSGYVEPASPGDGATK